MCKAGMCRAGKHFLGKKMGACGAVGASSLALVFGVKTGQGLIGTVKWRDGV